MMLLTVPNSAHPHGHERLDSPLAHFDHSRLGQVTALVSSHEIADEDHDKQGRLRTSLEMATISPPALVGYSEVKTNSNLESKLVSMETPGREKSQGKSAGTLRLKRSASRASKSLLLMPCFEGSRLLICRSPPLCERHTQQALLVRTC
jgi:hypothetical protein